MIYDHLDNTGLYSLGERWEQAFTFLKTLSADTPEGDYPLDGDKLYAKVMSYETIAPEAGVIENHQRYADIQVCLSGAEGFDLFDPEQLEIREPYDENRDLTFFQLESAVPHTQIHEAPGYFLVLWPRDAHRPKMRVGESRLIKKVVVKVALD